MDSFTVQHLLEMLLDLVQEGWGYSLELLLEGFLVQQLNDVLSCIRAPYLILVKGENIVVLHQHLLKFPGKFWCPLGQLIQPTFLS